MSNRMRVGAGTVLLLIVGMGGAALHISGGGPLSVDTAARAAIRGTPTSQWTTAVDLVTLLFSPWAVTVWTALTAVILYVRDSNMLRAMVLVATVTVAGAVCEALKVLVARPRPPVADQLGVLETTYSYPSGHVTGAAALVIATAALIAGTARTIARYAIWACAAVVVLLACATRLYLGVHWFSDVLAGIGIACAATVLVVPASDVIVSKWMSRHSQRTDEHHHRLTPRRYDTHAPSH